MLINTLGKIINSSILFRNKLFLPKNQFTSKTQIFTRSQREEISKNIGKSLKLESKEWQIDGEKKLWHMLKEKSQMIEGIAEVSQTISLCQRITDYYSIQRLKEFSTCRQLIEKLMNNMTFLPFADLSLDNYFSLLKFLAVVVSTQNIKARITAVLKDLIFLNIKPTINSLETLTMPQIVTLYATLAPFHHPQLATLAEKVEVQINKNTKQFDHSLAETVMVGLSHRKFLSAADIRVSKRIYQVLKEKSNQIPLPTLAKLYHTSQSIGLSSFFGDYRSLDCLHHLHNKLVSKLDQMPLNDPSIKYLTTSNLAKWRNPAIFLSILETVMKEIEKGSISSDILPSLISCLHKTGTQLSQNQIDKVIRFLDYARKHHLAKPKIFAKYPLEIVVIELVRTNAFDSHLQKFNSLIDSIGFDSKWSLVSSFSLKGAKYPKFGIQKKINVKTCQFTLDSNYLKASISIGVQIKHHPNSVILNSAYDRLKYFLHNCRWGERQIEWLANEAQNNPQLIKLFHELYGNIYLKRLKSFKDTYHPMYCLYYMAIEDYDCSLEDIKAFPINRIFGLMQRELKLNNEFVYGFLLFMIHQKIKLEQIKLKGDTQTEIVRLLLEYSNDIHSSSLKTIENYHKLVLMVFESYKNLKTLKIEFNHILRRLLDYPCTSTYYGTPQYTDLVNQCLQHITDISDADLAAFIIRCCIKQKKAIPSSYPINQAYFSKKELAQLQFDK